MATWQDQWQRLQGYLRPWFIISRGFASIYKTRPTWIGGSVRPDNISAKDYANAQLFQELAPGFKKYEGTTSLPSLVASAHGIVLEIGSGVGNQLDRFDKSKIDHIYGVEPNPSFVPPLLAEVERAGLHGKYTLILGPVEDKELLAKHGLKENSVDCILCVLTLCSVDNPDETMRWLYKLLKPGGVFIFWEHRRSNDFITRLVQEFWNPLWRYFLGGCNLNRSTEDSVRGAGDWDYDASVLKVGGDPAMAWSLLPGIEGRLVKRGGTLISHNETIDGRVAVMVA